MNINVHEKILPLATSPILVYVDYSYTLSIIRNHIQTDPWFYSNYIQLFFQKKDSILDGILKLFVTDCQGRVWYPFLPWLNYQTLQRSLIKTLDLDIIDLLMGAIDEENYIMLNWDEFYIPKGLTQLDRHYSHKTLIYGYSRTEACFFSIGFKNTRDYKQCKVPFSDFRKAYSSKINDQNAYHDTEICMMKFNEKFSFDFDITTLLNQLKDYYLSKNSLTNYSTHFNNYFDVDYFSNKNFVFGMDSYKQLQIYLEYLSLDKESSSQSRHYSFQPMHALWEHKNIMVNRIEFLKNNKYLFNESTFDTSYKQIEIKAKALRDLFIKFELGRNKNLIAKMLSMLDEIYNREKSILASTIEEISSNI